MATAESELDMAERHVRRGAELILQQRDLIRELEAKGQNTAMARKLLAEFESIQRLHVGHLWRLRAGQC